MKMMHQHEKRHTYVFIQCFKISRPYLNRNLYLVIRVIDLILFNVTLIISGMNVPEIKTSTWNDTNDAWNKKITLWPTVHSYEIFWDLLLYCMDKAFSAFWASYYFSQKLVINIYGTFLLHFFLFKISNFIPRLNSCLTPAGGSNPAGQLPEVS